ncbi:MAG: replicative DNA helicase [Saprospirales bacterium]|nr:MAG: replicative DNA helicase [Saprospirales bacterium]
MAEKTGFAVTSGERRLQPMRKDEDLNSLLYGKVQPQAVQVEEVLLGALMLDKDAFAIVIDILRPSSFYTHAHQLIFKAMLDMFEKNITIDLLTVKDELQKNGDLDASGGTPYLVDLTNKVASSANVEFHARIIAQKFIQRELIRVSTAIIKDAYDETKDVFDLLDEAEKNLFDITEQNLNRGFEKLSSLVVQARTQLEEMAGKENGLTGVPSGFTGLDRYTSGWHPSDLIILAARPGMGKTAFAMCLARNASMDYQKPVAIFSLEMSGLQLTQRLLSMEAGVSGAKIRTGDLDDTEWTRLHNAIEKLGDVPLFIDDTPGINIFELRAKCRRLKMQHDIQMVLIDYLQLMSGGPDNKKGNREQEISGISRALKGMAKELNVPVIALSQLSRAVETRSGPKRPQLSDLRESGAIEQDADIVTFLYRPDYYEMEETEHEDGLTELILAKHRNGALGTVELKFVKEHVKFIDYQDAGSFGSIIKDDFGGGAEDGYITRSSRMNDDTDVPF